MDKDPRWLAVSSLLGQKPDTQIAKIMGVSVTTVRKHRRALKRAPTQPKHLVDWEHWGRYLGEIADLELAQRIGCDRSTVTRKRLSLGITAHTKQE